LFNLFDLDLDIVCLPTDLETRKIIKEDTKLTIYEFIQSNFKDNIMIYFVALIGSIFLGLNNELVKKNT
jgi:hypothetical protein